MSHPIDPFIALSTGGKFYPLGTDPDRVDIRDIAHSLSQQCRYAGHTSEFWSVAAHSLEVSRRVEERCREWLRDNNDPSSPYHLRLDAALGYSTPERAALVALLHDASETYLQDIVRPIKPLVHGYAQWEESCERAIAQRFGLPHPWGHLVKAVDDAMVQDEVAQFFPPGSAAWKRYGITERRDYLTPLSPLVARTLFLDRFYELGGVA